MKLSRTEQETIITFNEADSTAEVFTFNGRMQRTLAKLAEDRPDDVRHVKGTPEGGETYIVPKGWIKVRASRIMSEAQREELVERARAMQRAKLSAEALTIIE